MHLEIGPNLAWLLWGVLVCAVLLALVALGFIGKLIDSVGVYLRQPRIHMQTRLNANTIDEMKAMLKKLGES